MDFTKIKCIGESCKERNISMTGAGGFFGARITFVKLKCPECGCVLLIMPMSSKYEYNIEATTSEERTEQRIKEAKERSDLQLAREIIGIRGNIKTTDLQNINNMKTEDLEELNRLVFMNYENRDSFLVVMRLAFEAGAKGATFNGVPGVEDEPQKFDDWIMKMKSKARLLRLRH